MTDIIRERPADAEAAARDRFRGTDRSRLQTTPSLGEDQLLAYVELLFFAYRDFTGDPDSILQEFGFGRAHHRVLHFVHRYPGLRVAELLQILKITKQSLARVLRDLIASGHIERKTGPNDRRERLLYTTRKGMGLADRLARPQIERIAAALGGLGQTPGKIVGGQSPNTAGLPVSHHETAQEFLYLMIDAAERDGVRSLMQRRGSRTHAGSAAAGPAACNEIGVDERADLGHDETPARSGDAGSRRPHAPAGKGNPKDVT